MRFEWDSKREFCSIGEILIKEAFSDTIFRYIYFFMFRSYSGNLLEWKIWRYVYFFFLRCLSFPNYKFLSFFLFCFIFPPTWDYFNIFSSFHVQFLSFISFIEWKCKRMRKFCGVENVRRGKKNRKRWKFPAIWKLIFFFCYI